MHFVHVFFVSHVDSLWDVMSVALILLSSAVAWSCSFLAAVVHVHVLIRPGMSPALSSFHGELAMLRRRRSLVH